MQPSLIVVQPPGFDPPRIGQILKLVRVPALIPKASVETIEVTVLHWLAGLDVDQRHPALPGPRDEAAAREFRAVVQAKPIRLRALRYDPILPRVTRMPESEASTSIASDSLVTSAAALTMTPDSP